MAKDDPKEQLVGRLSAARRLLIVTHARPDGDALGSMAALAASAAEAGKTATMLVPGDLPARYDFLFPADRPAGVAEFARLADEADLVVIVDTCAFSQLDHLDEALTARRGKIVVVDHHATADDIGSVRWMDTSAAAAGVMVGELIDALGWPLTAAAAEALLVAVTTDTGWFRYANTDARCLRAAARLFETGIHPDELYARLYQADRPERLDLLRRALDSAELHHDGRIATMVLRRSDFSAAKARLDETENFVNEPLRVGRVEVSILLVENPDCTRVSLRSRGHVDVARVAGAFGGGGHVRAAGLRLTGDVDALKARLLAACAEAL
ncbi:MAG TPA: DHH family phosphoesterase [Phycisphaerae bacterium]|nr:DHH family phosphoesterase [Phycisphaerae bacterium]